MLKIHHGSYKYKDVDTVDSVMLIFFWKKIIDVPQFILYVVTCIQASIIKLFDRRGYAVYWCVFVCINRQHRNLSLFRCKTSIIGACMHITTDNINSEFYLSVCQHHINCSIHIFIIRDAIIFNINICKLDVLVLYSFVLLSVCG